MNVKDKRRKKVETHGVVLNRVVVETMSLDDRSIQIHRLKGNFLSVCFYVFFAVHPGLEGLLTVRTDEVPFLKENKLRTWNDFVRR